MKPAIEAAKFLIALPAVVLIALFLGICAVLWIISALVFEGVSATCTFFRLCWIARGEPDARNDAEKDGGGM